MKAKDRRNINPTPAAVVAMNIYGKAYGEQRGGSMDFWDTLEPHSQNFCEGIAQRVIQAARAHGLKTWTT